MYVDLADDSTELDLSDQPEVSSNARIADTMLRLLHTMNRLRASIATARGDDTEWMQNNLLFHLARSGPMRAGTLAESLQADPSTVSRQVAALVKSGQVERRSDPDDGRASLLAVTGLGRELHQRHLDRRDVHYAEMLGDWSPADRSAFATLLDRYVEDFIRYKQVILAEACANRDSASREENE